MERPRVLVAAHDDAAAIAGALARAGFDVIGSEEDFEAAWPKDARQIWQSSTPTFRPARYGASIGA